MRELAEKLMAKYMAGGAGSNLESAVFGSVTGLAKAIDLGGPRTRVGVWPIRSSTQPRLAMGIAAILAFLLDDWSGDVGVYRLFAWLEGNPADYVWSMEKSQFEVDDWGLDDLNENAAVWGTLETTGGKWSLALEVENDLAVDPDDLKQLSYDADSLSQLVARLPEAASEILRFLDAGEQDMGRRSYQAGDWQESRLERALDLVFMAEVYLLLHLWGHEWPGEQAKTHYEQFFEACGALGGELGAWLAAHGLERGLDSLFIPLDSALFHFVAKPIAMFPESVYPYALLSDAVARLDSLKRGCELLEDVAEQFETDVMYWANLGRIYYRNRHFFEALDTYQRGIGAADVPVAYYIEYSDLLGLMDMSGVQLDFDNEREGLTGRIFVDGVVLADVEDVEPEDVLAVEMIAAYRAALKQGNDASVLHALVMALIEMENYDTLWDDFGRLVAADNEGELVRQVLNALLGAQDTAPAARILRLAVEGSPDRFDLQRNLGQALLLDEQYAQARDVLVKARGLAKDPAGRVEIDRMLLSVDDPDFEARIAELTTLLGAGVSPKADDVDFLENALEKMPTLAECYLLLAQAYTRWGESDDALDVLLDGQKQVPDHPRILEMLSWTLWQSGERELAMQYLKKALAANPLDVPLLALAGRCMFEDGEDEEAKNFLLRAEAIAPRDPALAAVRAYIARSIR